MHYIDYIWQEIKIEPKYIYEPLANNLSMVHPQHKQVIDVTGASLTKKDYLRLGSGYFFTLI